ncbi:hypothetical protein [Nonomuraea bangladeshensis]|uniref:hypothetical protein n=1 Tax=Nonomuraea bangladeshensis TaxID=404385 RepID=UPI0031D92575
MKLINRLPSKKAAMRASAAILLVAAISIWGVNRTLFEPWRPFVSSNRLELVALNAFAVSQIDYQVDFLEMKSAGLLEDSPITARGGFLPILLEPRSPEGISSGHWIQSAIQFHSSGRISNPHLGKSATLSRALIGNNKPFGDTESLISALSERRISAEVQVLVKPKTPLTDAGVSNLLTAPLTPDTIFISPPSSSAAVLLAWDRESCELRGVRGCQQSRATISVFSKWVDMLRPEDDLILKHYSLRYSKMQAYAREGRISAFIMTALPEDIEHLLSDPRIAWVHFLHLRQR